MRGPVNAQAIAYIGNAAFGYAHPAPASRGSSIDNCWQDAFTIWGRRIAVHGKNCSTPMDGTRRISMRSQ